DALLTFGVRRAGSSSGSSGLGIRGSSGSLRLGVHIVPVFFGARQILIHRIDLRGVGGNFGVLVGILGFRAGDPLLDWSNALGNILLGRATGAQQTQGESAGD